MTATKLVLGTQVQRSTKQTHKGNEVKSSDKHTHMRIGATVERTWKTLSQKTGKRQVD